MKMACDHSDGIKKLLVVDIAPRDYPADHHLPTLKALADLDLIVFNKERRWMKPLQKKFQIGLSAVSTFEFRECRRCFKWIPNLDGLISSIKAFLQTL